ncbi:MAG: hypothetical protein KF703_05105, partial [Actinobacteria bacterium]|nr:hypothetical protein [Actinomycetota bacterium]
TSVPSLEVPTSEPDPSDPSDPSGPGTAPPATSPPPATAPPAAPSTTAPPAPTTTRPAPTTTIPAPVVDGFRATASTTICRGGYRWTLVWATTGADSVQVGPSKGTAVSGDADGRAAACAPADSSFTLVATGPGGTTVATVQGRGPTATTTPVIIN